MYTGIGSVVGGLGGLIVGAPLDGMKVGGALGMQVIAHQQNTEIKKQIVDKVKEGADGAGRKVAAIADTANQAIGKIGDKTATVVEKVGEVAARAIIDVAQKYSAILLTAYAFSIVNTESNLSETFYLANCTYMFQNIVCVTRALKNFTLTGVSATIGICFALKAVESFSTKKKD